MNEIVDLQFYSQIRDILSAARNKVYSAANFAMVEAYWHIGKSIVENREARRGPNMARGLLPSCQRG